jgi:hypothetical protein
VSGGPPPDAATDAKSPPKAGARLLKGQALQPARFI